MLPKYSCSSSIILVVIDIEEGAGIAALGQLSYQVGIYSDAVVSAKEGLTMKEKNIDANTTMPITIKELMKSHREHRHSATFLSCCLG